MIQVVILCGGNGTRLQSETPDLPKSLHITSGLTLLEHQIKALTPGRFEVLLLIGPIQNLFWFEPIVIKLQEKYGIKIQVMTEKGRLGTAGALKSASKSLHENFIIMMGDVLHDTLLENVFHNFSFGDFLTLVLRVTDHPQDSDLAVLDQFGYVSNFSKYPHKQDSILKKDYFGLTGVFVMSKRLVALMPDNRFLDLNLVFEKIILTHGYKVRGIVTANNFKDVGTKSRFKTSDAFLEELRNKDNSNLVILDRDDTLMLDPLRNPIKKSSFNRKLIQKLKDVSRDNHKAKFIIVTNQAAIAKGLVTRQEVEGENSKLLNYLAEEGISVEAIFYCPHHNESGFPGEITSLKVDCRCRKPKPGLVLDYLRGSNSSPASISVMGNSKFDFLLSRQLGANFELVKFGAIQDKYRAVLGVYYTQARITLTKIFKTIFCAPPRIDWN
jgi:histidinol-phosphate phosphatase family protein